MKQLTLNALTTAIIAIFSCTAAIADSIPVEESPTVLITGSNASHGLAFTEEYAKLGWNVIATCRTPDEAERLNALAAENPNIVVENSS